MWNGRKQFFLPPSNFFSKPSKPFVSLHSTLLVPGSRYSSRVTNHSNKVASQPLRSPQLNIHHCPVKLFTRFSVELSFVEKEKAFYTSTVLSCLIYCNVHCKKSSLQSMFPRQGTCLISATTPNKASPSPLSVSRTLFCPQLLCLILVGLCIHFEFVVL